MIFLMRMAFIGLSGLWAGWVLKTLWFWFVFPWLGIGLSLKTAVGIDLFLSTMLMVYVPREGRTTLSDGKPGMRHADIALLHQVLFPAACLGWGALFRWAL